MNKITKDDLKLLAEKQHGLCASLYMPTHRALPETRQDPIRFKNLLTETERRLIEEGMRSSEAAELLQPALKLLDDGDYWRHLADGLAVFITRDKFTHFRLPMSFDELVSVGGRFHLKPLLQMFTHENRFYILAISQNQARLLEGTRFSVEEVTVENLPEGLNDVLGQYDFEKQLQFHTSAPAAGGGRAAMFHGHGQGDKSEREKVTQYFRWIDSAICEQLKEEKAPVIFAGVDQLFPLYREANSYPQLLDQYIPGNPDLLGGNQLHESAWEIVQPVFNQSRTNATAKYYSLAGTGLTETRLEEIVRAAHHGRIESLFVASGRQCWGHFDPENDHVRLHNKDRASSEDLLDLAALQTIETGGEVFIVEQTKVPGGDLAAAVYRY